MHLKLKLNINRPSNFFFSIYKNLLFESNRMRKLKSFKNNNMINLIYKNMKCQLMIMKLFNSNFFK